MKYDISVIIPCLNESSNIIELIERLNNVFNKRSIKGQIVIVDDGSKDNTQDTVNKLKKNNTNIVIIAHKENVGIFKSWKSGLKASDGEYISLLDADLQYLPEDIWRIYREIKHSNVDIVHGFRSSTKNNKKQKNILNKILNILVNLSFRTNLKDPISSMLICRKEVLEDLFIHKYNYNFLQILLIAIAKTKKYNIIQTEVLFQDRLLGKSFIDRRSINVLMLCIKDIIYGYIEYKIKYKKENILEEFLRQNNIKDRDNELSFIRKIWFKIFLITMPLHHWMISSNAGKYYYELKKSQWLTGDKIKELQEIKLRNLINHAYYHVPYYREIMKKNNISPSDIKKLEDINKIPLLNKQDVRDNLYFDMLSDNHKKNEILKITTSGSTGEPFVCFADKHQLEIRWASTLRSMEWTGYRFGDKQMRLWHQTLGMSFTQVIREKLDAIFNRRVFIPAFKMSDEKIKEFARKIERINPILIDGYAESFNFLAHYLKKYPFKKLKLKGIISSAQILPSQSREIIEKTFNCKVFNKYGSREFSGIAYECDAHDGHHIMSESYIVEILKDGIPAKPGETGEIVITDLNNFCMPLIRYRVGDLAVALDKSNICKCGRGLSKIGDIEGRIQAIIVGSNGNYIPGTFFAHFFKDYDYIIRQYQIKQKEFGEIELKIIKASRFDINIFNKCIDTLKEVLGKETKIEVEFVDEIAMVRTGKHQGSISNVKIDFQKINKKLIDNHRK